MKRIFQAHVDSQYRIIQKDGHTVLDRTDTITQTDSNKEISLCFEQEEVNQSQKEVKRFLTASQYS